VLWISATSATVAAVPDIAGLREDAKALSTLAADVDASMSRIQSAAAALSLRVFESAPGPQPSRLLVDAGDDLATVPWTLLRWPGSDTELLDHTAISHVRLEKRCCQLSSSRGLPQRVDVLVSSPDAATSGLSMLQMAASESRLISLALGKRMQANVMPVADKQTILDALSGSDRWIHIVAHGSTRPDRVGFNGIWLDAPGGNVITPSFLSGIDLLNGIVRTDLVVLSACALGRRASNPLQPSMSFADMATMAGAAHVISSLWPISDSATVVWVPAFYREAARGGEFDDALRGAQLALKASRQFRHPFFWAPFVHQERLILEPSAAAAAGALASVSRMP
jgi:CHAT domain-containing protein